MTNTHQLYIRRGSLINDDPQRRCYNGCYYKSHIEWSDWEHWMDYPSENQAKQAAHLFARETQQFKILKKSLVEHT